MSASITDICAVVFILLLLILLLMVAIMEVQTPHNALILKLMMMEKRWIAYVAHIPA